MNKVKTTISKTQAHIYRNRAKYAAAGTATTFLVLMHRSAQQMYAFLEEKGIDPQEFYCPEAYEEKQA